MLVCSGCPCKLLQKERVMGGERESKKILSDKERYLFHLCPFFGSKLSFRRHVIISIHLIDALVFEIISNRFTPYTSEKEKQLLV